MFTIQLSVMGDSDRLTCMHSPLASKLREVRESANCYLRDMEVLDERTAKRLLIFHLFAGGCYERLL